MLFKINNFSHYQIYYSNFKERSCKEVSSWKPSFRSFIPKSVIFPHLFNKKWLLFSKENFLTLRNSERTFLKRWVFQVLLSGGSVRYLLFYHSFSTNLLCYTYYKFSYRIKLRTRLFKEVGFWSPWLKYSTPVSPIAGQL